MAGLWLTALQRRRDPRVNERELGPSKRGGTDRYFSSRRATIDVERGARDVARIWSGKKRDRARDLLDPAIATERDEPGHLLRELAVGGVHVGVDRSRLHCVDQDVARGEVLCPAAATAALVAL